MPFVEQSVRWGLFSCTPMLIHIPSPTLFCSFLEECMYELQVENFREMVDWITWPCWTSMSDVSMIDGARTLAILPLIHSDIHRIHSFRGLWIYESCTRLPITCRLQNTPQKKANRKLWIQVPDTVEPWYRDHLWAAANVVFIVRWSLYRGGRGCDLGWTNWINCPSPKESWTGCTISGLYSKVVSIPRWSLTKVRLYR